MKAGMKAALFYAGWYPRQWWPLTTVGDDFHPDLGRHLRYAARTSRRLARGLFHAMARFGPKLEKRQVLLGRFVEIGTELFAMTASCGRAQNLGTEESRTLADYFCKLARQKIDGLFRDLRQNSDAEGYRLTQRILEGEFHWVEAGMLEDNEWETGGSGI
jgi:hypothetical protein